MWNGDQAAVSDALQLIPSKARICSQSPTVPVKKEVWASCAAVMSITVPAAWATPPTTKWPLAESRVESHSWYLVMVSPSGSLTENRLDSAKLWLSVVFTSAV